MNSWGTLSTSGSTFTLKTEGSGRPEHTPSGLVATRGVQTRDGWLGQVIVDKEIVWESEAQTSADDAVDEANARVVKAFKALFVVVPDNA